MLTKYTKHKVRTFSQELFAQKCLEIVFLAQKHLFFGLKFTDLGGTLLYEQKGLTDWGGNPPTPPFTDKVRKIVFDVLPKYQIQIPIAPSPE